MKRPVVTDMGGAPDPPKQSAASKKLEQLQIQQLQAQIAAAGKKQPEFKQPEPVKYAPPPSATSADAEAQARELRLAASRRRGFLASMRGAGSTGGFKKTLG